VPEEREEGTEAAPLIWAQKPLSRPMPNTSRSLRRRRGWRGPEAVPPIELWPLVLLPYAQHAAITGGDCPCATPREGERGGASEGEEWPRACSRMEEREAARRERVGRLGAQRRRQRARGRKSERLSLRNKGVGRNPKSYGGGHV
jgi:hypothetical protein